ncbi:MAG: PA2169 family four-helix-bundle protein [Flavobacteriales bacterium]
MIMELRNDLTQLNNVKDLLVDSQKGYREAAARVEDLELKGILTHLSDSRTPLLAAMDRLIEAAAPDQPPREGGTLKGDLHRTWMDVRDSLSTSENANVLAECERGEEFLLMRYEEVLKRDDLVPVTRNTLQEQHAVVKGNLDRVKQLRSGYEKKED